MCFVLPGDPVLRRLSDLRSLTCMKEGLLLRSRYCVSTDVYCSALFRPNCYKRAAECDVCTGVAL